MTDTKMSFKDALIAHLQGEAVEVKSLSNGDVFEPFGGFFNDPKLSLPLALSDGFASLCVFRIKPRTVMCNGVEVPAPESVAPKVNDAYFLPHVFSDELYAKRSNFNEGLTDSHVGMGIVYLNKEDAIARAKAMLITK